MTIEEMKQACREVLAAGGTHINFVLPKGVSSRIKGFPRGRLLVEHHDGSRVFQYRADRVLAALEKADAD